MAIAWFPVIIAANGKVQEAGHIMFFCGLLVLCFVLSREVVRLL